MEATTSLFDTAALAREYNISPADLDALAKRARADFGDDEMMVELHILRAIRRTRLDEETFSIEMCYTGIERM